MPHVGGRLGICSKALKMFTAFGPIIYSAGFYPVEMTRTTHKDKHFTVVLFIIESNLK